MKYYDFIINGEIIIDLKIIEKSKTKETKYKMKKHHGDHETIIIIIYLLE